MTILKSASADAHFSVAEELDEELATTILADSLALNVEVEQLAGVELATTISSALTLEKSEASRSSIPSDLSPARSVGRRHSSPPPRVLSRH